jgi:hypothetical protein
LTPFGRLHNSIKIVQKRTGILTKPYRISALVACVLGHRNACFSLFLGLFIGITLGVVFFTYVLALKRIHFRFRQRMAILGVA